MSSDALESWGGAPRGAASVARPRRPGRLGSVAGIEIYVHWSFLLLIGWILLSHLMQGHGLGAGIEGVVFILALFGCVVLHELGHALTARHYGVRTRDITLYPIGGVARLERMPERPIEELWVALAGPAVNVVIAALLFGVLWLAGPMPAVGSIHLVGGDFLAKLLSVNVMLAGFNLVPAFPMDGGRVLRALLAMRMDYVRATQVAASAGQGIAILFGFLGLFINPFLIFIALFVFVGAQQEAYAAQTRSILSGVPVREAMMTRFTTLEADAPLSAAVHELIASGQQDFPIMRDGQLAGLLPRTLLLRGLAHGPGDAPIADVMVDASCSVDETEMLDAAFERMQQAPCPMLPVLRGTELVGLLTPENVSEWMMVQASLHARPHHAPA